MAGLRAGRGERYARNKQINELNNRRRVVKREGSHSAAHLPLAMMFDGVRAERWSRRDALCMMFGDWKTKYMCLVHTGWRRKGGGGGVSVL